MREEYKKKLKVWESILFELHADKVHDEFRYQEEALLMLLWHAED